SEIAAKEAEALIDGAIAAGKVAPANREMYLALCRSEDGRTQFAEFVKGAPVIVSKEPEKKKDPGQGDTTTLSDEDLAMCHAMGISKEEFISVRKQES
ncbi:hypothetical protein GTGU_04773, partial [Trabulsiella guamensis ATCC 49490]